MQSPGPAVGRRQATCIASRIQLFERLSRSLSQPARSLKQRQVSTSAAGLDAEPSSKPTTLNFKTHYQCAYGEQLKLVGNTEELGNWDVGSAPSLNWTSGDAWTGQVALQKADDAQFKLVLLGHEGILWEPVADRKLQNPSAPEMNVNMAWGTEGLQLASEQHRRDSNAEQSSAATEFDLLWNPTQTGHTPSASPATLEKAKDRKSFDVTLEPEWGVLDLDAPTPGSEESQAVSAVDSETREAEPQGSLHELESHSVALAAESLPAESEGRGLVKKRKKNKGRRSFRSQSSSLGRQPGIKLNSLLGSVKNLAVGALTAATLSAVGVHGQDLLMGTFSITTGTAVLPRILDARKGILEFDARETVLSVVLGIGESALKAASIFNAARQGLEKTTRRVVAPVTSESQVEDDNQVEISDFELLESELAEYVAGLAQEATEYAMRYSPTEEEVFEASLACSAIEKDAARSNIVSKRSLKSLGSICNA